MRTSVRDAAASRLTLLSQPHDAQVDGKDASGMDESISPRERRWQRFRRMALLSIPVMLVIAGFAYLALQRSADAVVNASDVQTALATTEVITESAAFVGRITPRDLVQIGAPEGGRVVSMSVRSGDRVEAGDVLLTLSNPERQLAISERMARIRSEIYSIVGQRSSLADAESADTRAVLEAEFTRNEAAERLRRQEILLEKGLVNEAYVQPLRERFEFSQRMTSEAAASARQNEPVRAEQRRAMNDQVAALRRDYAAAELQLKAFSVTAPIGGIVLGLQKVVGETVDLGTPIAQINPMTGVLVVAQLDEFYAARVQVGQRATTTIGGRDFALRVAHVSPDVRDGAFRVELEFDGTAPPIRPGETIQGSIEFPASGLFHSEDSLMVRFGAISRHESRDCRYGHA